MRRVTRQLAALLAPLLFWGVPASIEAKDLTVSSGGPAAAAEQSAQAFVEHIYAAYTGPSAKGISLDGYAAYVRYFTPELARMIDKDATAAAKRGEVPTLDGDPFIDAQDWQIESLAIELKDIPPNKALGKVRFKNVGEDRLIELDLVKLKQGWRIADIRGPSGSLRSLFGKR
jgi:Protein of unknown function (DUF3828)